MEQTSPLRFVEVAIFLNNDGLLPEAPPSPPSVLTAAMKAAKFPNPSHHSVAAASIVKLMANAGMKVGSTNPNDLAYGGFGIRVDDRNHRLSILSARLSRFSNRTPGKFSLLNRDEFYRELVHFAQNLREEGYDLFWK